MRAINLVFGTNNGIAAGTPDARIEQLYQRAFKPFLSTLYEFPEVAITLHYSGVLLEWLHERHPEFIMLINEMIKRGQIEILGGTYYQTVLPLIPSNDRTAQIELLTTLIRRRFGKRPRGAWITELVWEPGMPSSLKRSGMDYVFLTESQFSGAGLKSDDLFKPVLTEDQGKALFVFPISEEKKLVPFATSPKDAAESLAELARDEEGRVVSLIADGEYFGHWNDTYRLLYEDGWFAGFLREISNLKRTVVTTHPRKYIKSDDEYNRCYFACTSYEEMMKWALSPDRGKELEKLKSSRISKSSRMYLTGGYFRQFLSKYPESNLMYAKLIRTYDLVNQVRGDKYRKKAAREELWKGEDHSAYWHGKRGGIYINHSRKAVYSALISAEKTSRQRGIFKSHISTLDFDLDGNLEYLCNGYELNMYIHRKGGMVFELDYMTKPWNYLDTLSRRTEHYHEALADGAVVDPYPRRAFLDHFFSPDEPIEKIESMTYKELGNLLTMPYQVTECRKDHLDAVFSADGSLSVDSGPHPVSLKKRYRMKRGAILVDYSIANRGPDLNEICFSPEINLSFPGDDSESLDLAMVKNASSSAIADKRAHESGIEGFTALDKKNSVAIKAAWNTECNLLVFPIEAQWLDQEGAHSEYQSTCFFPIWTLSLAPDAVWDASIQISFSKSG